ncbi:hypothetical protein [Neptuniibacter sp. QD34_54]|uniref:hypothetical protein n=1 Tax=Neptuniibacter sp. QD34_54 TaxID=3398208 RepID=UPI0039F5E603
MTDSKRCFVIAVAGAPGSGKTSLTLALAKLLDADTLFYDDYQQATNQSMAEILQWMKQGSDYNNLNIPGFAEAIVAQIQTTHKRFLLIETPLGRHHHASGRYIDCLVWLDTPLDISLARNIKAFSNEFKKAPSDYVQQLDWLANYLEGYIQDIRATLVIQQERLAKDADINIDGTLPLGKITQQIHQAISQEQSKG